jgi:ABC-type amino acid transport substrate-binding protein
MRRVARVAPTASACHRFRMTICAIAWLATPAVAVAQAKKNAPAPPPAKAATTLERVRSSGTLKLGYRIDAPPFSYQEPNKPTGYSIDVCQHMADMVKSEMNLPALKVQWVPVTVENQLQAVEQHDIDAMCGSVSVTLERRKQVDFSSPIFPGGVGAVVRSNAPKQLRNILSGQAQDYRPTWRAVALNILREQTFITVPGTTAEAWLDQRRQELQVQSRTGTVPNYATGIKAVLAGQAGAFFAERAVLLDEVRRDLSDELMVIDRQFTYEPLALAVPRGDDDFRLFVDRSLSRFYNSPGFATTYVKWFGKPDETAKNFFRWNALPE